MTHFDEQELEDGLVRIRALVKEIDRYPSKTPEWRSAARRLDSVMLRHIELIRKVYAQVMS